MSDKPTHSPSTLALALRLHAEITEEIAVKRDREDADAFGITDALGIERTVSET